MNTAHLIARVQPHKKQPYSLGIIHKIFPLVFAVIYAGCLASLPLEIFKDRANYLEYTQFSDVILSRYSDMGVISILANEPLWLLMNISLSRFLYPDEALQAIIFFPAFVVSWKILESDPRNALWLIIFLLAPQVLKNHIVHLRQGVALSIFLLGYFARPKWLGIALMISAGFIHISFVFICVIGVAVWASNPLQLSPRFRALVLIICFIFMGALIGLVAGGVGARQALVYADADLDITGAGFLFWSFVFLLFASAGVSFLKNQVFSFSILACYLAMYFITPVAGRIFESGIFFVFQAGLTMLGARRWVFLTAFSAYAMAQYLMRFDQPWLGWGI